MNCKKIMDFKPIYDYIRRVGERVPYFFDADYELWAESFDGDTDADSEIMFAELETYAAYSEEELVGFIQFGIPHYVYSEGGKEYRTDCGVIRQLFFDEESGCADELLGIAEEYFRKKHVTRQFAFYHAFGMTCYAHHGKLFAFMEHIEAVLLRHSFVKEHENVYFSRMLTENDTVYSGVTELVFGVTNSKGVCGFTIKADGETVGAGELVYLPQGGICYLKLIYIFEQYQRKGYAASALRELFSELYKKGVRRTDTDTADINEAAIGLYNKLGFTDMGRTKSYLK